MRFSRVLFSCILLMRFALTLCLSLIGCHAYAAGALVHVATRASVTTSLFWEPVEGATATVLLFPGGAGGFGAIDNGRPVGGNFLVRSTDHFVRNKFNVAIIGRPSDSKDLDYADRISDWHLIDIQKVLEYVHSKSAAPLWLIGTSRGTVSVTHTVTQLKDLAIAGIVLSSSIVSIDKPGAVPKQNLASIKLPTLVIHHRKDSCRVCLAHEVPAILKGLSNAPIKKLLMVDGGANPSGDACGAQHWHGYVGMEAQAVDMIADWIRQPAL